MAIVPRKEPQDLPSTNLILDESRTKNVLQAMAQACLPPPYAIEVARLAKFADLALFPAEISAIAGAAPIRRATFLAGRGCARAALGELGSPDAAIPMAPSGAPIWPQGFVGSITHTSEIAAAVVASSENVLGLGLDLETDDPLDDAAMLRMICRPEELLTSRDPSDPANLKHGKLIFVVKEAVYKLYRPLCDAFLEFEDLSVSLDESKSTFVAKLTNPKHPAITPDRAITGVFANSEGLFIALAGLRQPTEESR